MRTHADSVKDEKINVSLTLFGSIILVALLLLLNAFPNLVGVWVMTDGTWLQVTSFTPEFLQNVLPWINVGLGLTLALNCLHIIYGRWTPGTRWADLGLTVFSLVVLYQILHAGPLLQFSPEALDGVGSSAVFVVPDTVFQGVLWLAFVGTAIGTVVRLVRLLQDAICEPVRTCT
jgi:hypothetical protein